MNEDKALSLLGKEKLYDYQEQPLKSLLNGDDIFVSYPTGAGKSLVFQMAALMTEGLFIVVEPLIALENDQVASMRKNGVEAYCINSCLKKSERESIFSKIKEGTVSLLYLSAEMLRNEQVSRVLHDCNPKGIIIDEAHCVVKYGYGFREEYLMVGNFINSLKKRPVIGAFTATVTDETRDEVIRYLAMSDVKIYRRSVLRSNICLTSIEIGESLRVKADKSIIEKRKREEIVSLIDETESGRIIIYCNTVKRVQCLHKYLKKKGYKASKYHGKNMKSSKREKNMKKFVDGKVKIMVCTNAFGLGVDIPDIRLVIHHSPAMGLDDYVQEAGRAGRDGKASHSVLLWNKGDFTINENLIKKAAPSLTGKQMQAKLKPLEALKEFVLQNRRCKWKLICKFFDEDVSNVKRCNNCENCKRHTRRI